MRGKKGVGTEVDWIIAIGIFLVYLGIVLVLFKPGLKPVVETDTLLNIVQKGIEEQLMWNVTKQPIFTEPVAYTYPRPGSGGGTLLGTSNNLQRKEEIVFEFIGQCESYSNPTTCNPQFKVFATDFPAFMSTTEMAKRVFVFQTAISSNPDHIEGETYVLDDGREPPSLRTSPPIRGVGRSSDRQNARTIIDNTRGRDIGKSWNIPDSGERKLKYRINSDRNLEFQLVTNFDRNNPKRKYLLVYSLEDLGRLAINNLPIHFNTNGKHACAFRDYVCNPNDPLRRYPNDCPPLPLASSCRIMYTLGAAEKLEGYHVQKFLGLDTFENTHTLVCPQKNKRGYDCVKEIFGYPEIKDFEIRVKTIDSDLIDIKFPENMIPKEARVSVRQFNSFILTEEALKIPIVITITVW